MGNLKINYESQSRLLRREKIGKKLTVNNVCHLHEIAFNLRK